MGTTDEKTKNTNLKLKQTVENYFVFLIMHINVTGIITITMIMQRAVILNTCPILNRIFSAEECIKNVWSVRHVMFENHLNCCVIRNVDGSDDHGHNYDDNMKIKRKTQHGFPGAPRR